MSDYAFIGRVVSAFGSLAIVLAMVMLLSQLCWAIYKQAVGWPRIVKAMQLLRESEKEQVKS